jgi:hypothetical protein
MRAALCVLLLSACAVPTPAPRQGGPADPGAPEAPIPPASRTLLLSEDAGTLPPAAEDAGTGGMHHGGMQMGDGGMQMGPDGGTGGAEHEHHGGAKQKRRKPRPDGGQP